MKIIMLKFRRKFLLLCHHNETQHTQTNTAGTILPMKRVGARQVALLQEASSASVRAGVKHLVDKLSKLLSEARPFDLQSLHSIVRCQKKYAEWTGFQEQLFYFRHFYPSFYSCGIAAVTFFSCIALHGRKKLRRYKHGSSQSVMLITLVIRLIPFCI